MSPKVIKELAKGMALLARSVPGRVSGKKRRVTPPSPERPVLTDNHDKSLAGKSTEKTRQPRL